MQYSNLGLILTVLNLTFLGNPRLLAQEAPDFLQEFWKSQDRRKPPLERFADAPLCHELFKRRQLEFQFLSIMLVPDAVTTNDWQKLMATYYPDLYPDGEYDPKKIADEQAVWSDAPQHPLPSARTMQQLMRRVGPMCFEGSTPVTTLENTTEGNWFRRSERISQVALDSYVLSHPNAVIPDPRYHQACWAKVFDIKAGIVKPGEPLHRLYYNYSESSSSNDIRITATPGHRFFAREHSSAVWSWLPISEIVTRSIAGRPYPSDPSVVVHATRGPELFSLAGYQTARYSFTYNTSEEIQVYNLSVPWTHTYFVGPMGHEILVHNSK